MKIRLLILAVATLLISCNKKKDEPELYTETLVYQDDSQLVYLCDYEWKDVLVGDNPKSKIEGTIWRIPTKDEAEYLHTFSISNGSQRYLCIDNNETYYTFWFSGQGSISKAGAKTKYAVRPIRVITFYQLNDTTIYL